LALWVVENRSSPLLWSLANDYFRNKAKSWSKVAIFFIPPAKILP